MELSPEWIEFAGLWLLFAGPVFQSNLELDAESDARQRVQEVRHAGPRPVVSLWWWLLPPVRAFLVSRERRVIQLELFRQLPADQQASVLRYQYAARGWMLVGLGAWLLACAQTITIGRHAEWSPWLITLVLVAATTICLAMGHPGPRRPRRGRAPADER